MAQDTLAKGVKVNVAAVMRDDNLDSIRKYHIEQYPTVRLFNTDGKYKEFHYQDDGSDLHEKNILEFIRQEGVDVPSIETDPAKRLAQKQEEEEIKQWELIGKIM